MRYSKGIDENFELYQVPIIERGDWVKLINKKYLSKGPDSLVEGKIYWVSHDQGSGFGVPDKIGIWDDVLEQEIFLYVTRFEYIERQKNLLEEWNEEINI